MEKATSNNVKPGVWLRTSKEDRRYTPDGLFICKSIIWNGDNKKGNKIILQPYYDYETNEWDFKEEWETWDVIEDMGLSSTEASWAESMGTLSIYKSTREVMKDIIEDPLK